MNEWEQITQLNMHFSLLDAVWQVEARLFCTGKMETIYKGFTFKESKSVARWNAHEVTVRSVQLLLGQVPSFTPSYLRKLCISGMSRIYDLHRWKELTKGIPSRAVNGHWGCHGSSQLGCDVVLFPYWTFSEFWEDRDWVRDGTEGEIQCLARIDASCIQRLHGKWWSWRHRPPESSSCWDQFLPERSGCRHRGISEKTRLRRFWNLSACTHG